jgi:hypothetical protein
MTFKNRRYFTKQEFEIKKTSLNISKKTLFDEVEYETSLEQLDNKKKIEVRTNSNLFFIGLFVFGIGIFFLSGSIIEMTAICTVICIVLVIAAFIDKKRVITIASYEGENITFYFNSKNKQEVIQFVEQIFQASNAFLHNKYSKIDRALPIEPQLNNIQFLRNREVISEEEYNTLKNELLGRENQRYIGFSNNN